MRSALALFAGVLAFTAWTAGAASQQEHADAAKLKSPVKATPEAIAGGKTIYAAQCVNCHGETGKGDGKLAPTMMRGKPADFTDASWKHGATEGEIFTVIKDGIKGSDMRGFATRIKNEDDIWNVVHYLKTLGPSPATKPRSKPATKPR